MKNESDESYLFCMPAQPEFRHTVVTIDHCCICGQAVWRSVSSPPEPKAICAKCGLEKMAHEKEIEIMPASDAQIADIEAKSKRHAN